MKMCSTVCLLVKMLRNYEKLLVRTMKAQKMLQMKDIMFSLINFKQFDHENAETMYSRLNILVNEINSLDVKKLMI